MSSPHAASEAAAPGLTARALAVETIRRSLRARIALDDVFDSLSAQPPFDRLDARDRALARAIAVVSFRWMGSLRRAIVARLARGESAETEAGMPILIAGAAQIVHLDIPDHAAVDTTVQLMRQGRQTQRLAGLANAVLRRVAAEREAIRTEGDPLRHDTPPWLAARWSARYGADVATAIAASHLAEAPLDLTAKAEPPAVSGLPGAILMPTGTIRVRDRRPVPDLPGYAEGAWWVQDLAAAVPARLLHARPGERVLEFCAAPGGKTAQLAASGAAVTAVDISAKRLRRVEENLARLGLKATLVAEDALSFSDAPFDAILIDAPCSATGTMRRHPDVAWLRREADIAPLVRLQTRLIERAVGLLRPGGRLVFSTCSLEAEEGERQADMALHAVHGLRRVPIDRGEVGQYADWLDGAGDFRALPCHWPDEGGCDGFFAVRLQVC